MMASTTSISPRDNEFHGRGVNLAVISIVFTAAAISLVCSRLFTRRTAGQKLGWCDYAISVSVVFSIGLTVSNCIAVYHGSGKSSKTLTSNDLHVTLQAFWVAQILYKFTISCTKTSICFLYLRIFPNLKFQNTVWFVVAYVNLYAIASIIATIFQCTPIERIWKKNVEGTCINLTAFWYANAAANILGDFVILALPMPVVKSLKLPGRQKLGLMLVFALGGFVCITSILRMTTLKTGAQATDVTYGVLNSTIWSTVEANTAIICACLPMLKAPLARLFPQLFPRGPSASHGYPSVSTSCRPTRQSGSPGTPCYNYDSYGRLDSKRPLELLRVSTGTTKAISSQESTEASKSSDEIFGIGGRAVPLGHIANTTHVDVKFNGKDWSYTGSPQKPSPTHVRTVSEVQLVRQDHSPNDFA